MSKERNLIAHFPSSTKAERAIQELASIGVSNTEIKRNSKFGSTSDPVQNDILSQRAETLTGITLFSSNEPNEFNQDARILMSADPSVSGMSARGYGFAGGEAFTLVAFAPEEKVEQAVNIIKKNGGDI